jgi:hypothetical protein
VVGARPRPHPPWEALLMEYRTQPPELPPRVPRVPLTVDGGMLLLPLLVRLVPCCSCSVTTPRGSRKPVSASRLWMLTRRIASAPCNKVLLGDQLGFNEAP